MTKQELIRLVILNLGGGNVPPTIQGSYTEPQVEKLLEMVFDDIIYTVYAQAIKTGVYDDLDAFIRPYYMNILYDAKRDERYSELPIRGTSIPDTVAVRQVSPTKGQRLSFSIVENTSIPVFSELEVDFIDGRVSAYIEAGRMYYDRKLPKAVDEVLIKMVSPFSAFADDDNISIPLGANEVIFTKVLQILMNKGQSRNEDDMVNKQI